eukprot:CAMPEP_0194674488 /NCGR_PEP_ID=MMETSP0295-20121207/7682_1 /TAXON_ID=39354 /ORGANISM="Heterosigma akashiwo, Strain CCMP2393" /LENGTH=48 /DNA_ID= /DNA_START= /DNA_END= /DNA_ORIENTATION=
MASSLACSSPASASWSSPISATRPRTWRRSAARPSLSARAARAASAAA